MKHDKHRYGANLAFLDLLFNLLMAFAFLFLMSFLLVRPPAESKPAVEMKAEFILTMSWPDGALDDQDVWILLPNGMRLGYANRDLGFATLDRDDRGGIGNIYTDADGKPAINRIHREIVTIRTIMPGRYVVNVHAFAVSAKYADFESQQQMPYPVKIEAIKINPRVTEFAKAELLIEERNQQKTFFAFTVDAAGEITSVEKDIDEPFVIVNPKGTGS